MNKKELEIISKRIVRIIEDSKATFFVKDKDVEILPEEVLYELRATICTNVELYLAKLIDEIKCLSKK